ncbi:GNAT family N-acetyltransferase [Gilliamella sp. wkB112]|uniref:GNAT family N-acetyltransferase n=1 Tax=Gilliamella sp. wkB112 TaxID=3120257 RepID=UPI00080EE42F|nr:GNAT family N-acetyltransferase [Gilliamella apicola]OCG03987.1 hypothetical protein A9G12_07405 [Gilliamella apicola]
MSQINPESILVNEYIWLKPPAKEYSQALYNVISFNRIDSANKTAYIGYWLDSRIQGHGIMTQALHALTKYYAEGRIIKRFVIKCSTDNSKSNQVAKRCGFSYEGTLKQAEYLNGIYHDQNIYALISSYL